MAILYKGAGSGTHWSLNDATQTGFSSASDRDDTPDAVMRHIVSYSHPSPYLSFTTSYAVAYDYAAKGAGQGPGYVYEIDTSRLPEQFIDPIRALARSIPGMRPLLGEHDGGQDLILAVSSIGVVGDALMTPPRRLGTVLHGPARFTPEFQALVFALRDAEVLLRSVPAGCVVARHGVHFSA